MGALISCGILAIIFLIIASSFTGGTSRYPDGRCYICRRGVASPGDTCPKCGEVQPDVY